MHKNEIQSHEDRLKKNIKFLSILLPLGMTLWFILINYGEILSPKSFEFLPQNARINHITSLIFRADSWHFPFTLTTKIASGVPLILTNAIPLPALIFKLFGSDLQYFGIWVSMSFLLVSFFGYRISYLMTSNRFIAALGSLLFITMPFLWTQTQANFYMAGQWLIIWAYYIFFQKKSYMSREWYVLIGISCFVHPFFTFVCFLIMLADLFHLYIYHHSISVVKAATSLGHHLANVIFLLSFAGFFYLPFFYDPIESIPTLYLQQLHLNLGIAMFSAIIIVLILAMMYFKQSKKYLRYYKPLVSTLLVFLVLGLFGNIFVYTRNFIQIDWMKEHIFGTFTSGSKFLTPIFWMIPIIVIHMIGVFEKTKKSMGLILLSILSILQVQEFVQYKVPPAKTFVELPQYVQSFFVDRKNIIWIFEDKNIPSTPPYFEEFAYFAYQSQVHMNAGSVIRFPTAYRQQIEEQYNAFLNNDFRENSIYLLDKSFDTTELKPFGDIVSYKDVILFRPHLKQS